MRDPEDVSRYDEELGKVTIGGVQPLTRPIEIDDYDEDWPLQYEREEVRIRSVLGDQVIRLQHVGSKRSLAACDWKYAQQYADAKTGVIGEIMARAEPAVE